MQVKQAFRDLNITASFIPSGCTGYVQVLDVAINKPLKTRVSELADIHYDENFERWSKGSYTVGDRWVMLTKWVGQAWRELHTKHASLIRQTFRKLGLSLAVDGSEDEELSIKDIPNVQVGDWALSVNQEDIQEVRESDSDVNETMKSVEAEKVVSEDMEMEYVMEDELEDDVNDQEAVFDVEVTEHASGDELSRRGD